MKRIGYILGVLLITRLLLEIPLHVRVIILIPSLIVFLIAYLCSDIDLIQEEQRHD